MKLSKLGLSLSASLALVACGGGGDGGSSPATPTTSPTTTVTRADIDGVFRIGVLSSDLVALYEQTKLPFFAGFLVGASNATGGSTTPTAIACSAGGNVTVSVTRTGTYQGFNANDSASFGFNNCSFTGQPITYNGSTTLTSLNGARGLDSTGTNINNLQFRLFSTNLSIAQASVRVVHNGSVNATYSSTASSLGLDVTAQTSHSYAAFNPATATAASITTTSSANSRLLNNTTSSNTFALGYTGRITITTSSGTAATEITTPTTITGSRNTTSGALIPTAGVMNVTETSTPIATRGTFSPGSLTISGDTDRNGTLDLTFATIY